MIELSKLNKSYGNKVILENVSYTFPEEGLVCIFGPSGGGKSTLLNLIAGFDRDYTGEIKAFNKEINKFSKDEMACYRRDNIGFVFQNYQLLKGYTVLENILMPCKLNSLTEEENKEKIIEILEALGIQEKINEKIEDLSGGQKQRVAIARALINDPSIILADEPTGALDRETSTEIMRLLKEFSKDKLLIVVTHDKKLCEFADEIIEIDHKKIISNHQEKRTINKTLVKKSSQRIRAFSLGFKNFRVYLQRFLAISLAVSIGICAFMLSISSRNIMEGAIKEFKNKNTAFNNGYIMGEDDGTTYNLLKEDKRIENVYYQYKLKDITLSHNETIIDLEEKYPTAKATEKLSYGVMPRERHKEIALSPSLAKKFTKDIKTLLGKEIKITYGGIEKALTVSGIFNAVYDDFLLSSDIEKSFYRGLGEEKNYSISYDVKAFEDICTVSEMLKEKGIDSKNASEEVKALQSSFNTLSRLFFIVSFLIFGISLFLCIVLLLKLQRSRYRDLGLLAALGFNEKMIKKIQMWENYLFSIMSMGITLGILSIIYLAGRNFNWKIIISIPQILGALVVTFLIAISIGRIMTLKLIKMDPAKALRM